MTFLEYFKNQFGNVSLESLISGQRETEIEYCMYVEIESFEELKRKAFKAERQEQWTIPIDQDKVDGKMRIRLIDDVRPTMCTKIKREGMIGCEEVESDISMDQFNHLRKMAKDGYVKTRYSVPSNIPGLIWEVDVFTGNGGSPHPWVKVDLEVKSLNDPIPSFPISTTRVILADYELTHSESQKIKSLWEKEWQKLDA